MSLVALYRRLMGTDAATTAEEARLHRNLSGMETNNHDLDRLGAELDDILYEVDRHSIQMSLPPEGVNHG
jgi:hypothetical protein